jgi:hypothetical protein
MGTLISNYLDFFCLCLPLFDSYCWSCCAFQWKTCFEPQLLLHFIAGYRQGYKCVSVSNANLAPYP